MKIKTELEKLKNIDKAKVLSKYFKTGKGEYGEGDIFLGVTVPNQREAARKYFRETSLEEIQELFNSKVHEHRMVATMLLVFKMDQAYRDNNKTHKTRTYYFYVKNFRNINNWDLVDNSASYIIGRFFIEENKSLEILKNWAKSKDLWTRRISIIATHYIIKKERKEYYDFILDLAKILMQDDHDLIHKAVGWTLRELGKKDEEILLKLLEESSKAMPRTMLRYSIERLSQKQREKYMRG